MSIGASGTISKTLTFFTSKGRAVVREWLKPANPMSEGQGDQRIIMGGTGRGVAQVKPTSSYAQQLIDLALIPGGQTKQSFLVKYIKDHFLVDATAYAAMLAELAGHDEVVKWHSVADSLSLVAFDLPYAAVAPYDKALGIYLVAKAAVSLNFVGAPYTTALADWTSGNIDTFVADMAAAQSIDRIRQL